jgi:hypothetical protein
MWIDGNNWQDLIVNDVNTYREHTKNNKKYYFLPRDIFDKVKADIRLMKEELASIERFRGPKERSLAQCRSSLEAMQATKEGLESELHQVKNFLTIARCPKLFELKFWVILIVSYFIKIYQKELLLKIPMGILNSTLDYTLWTLYHSCFEGVRSNIELQVTCCWPYLSVR